VTDTTPTTDRYAFWRAGRDGRPLPAHEGDPQPGFYRRPRKGHTDDAVAYWIDQAGEMRCLRNRTPLDRHDGADLWTFVCDRPVTHKDYLFRLEQGHWPNENPVVAEIGHNRAPDEGSVDALISVLDALRAEAGRIIKAGPAKSQGEADQASDVANELMEVAKKAASLHQAEKAPVLAEGKAIDKKWFTVRDAAIELKERLRAVVVTPFLVAARRAAEQAAEKAVQRGEEPPPVQVKAGSLKRTTALRMVITARVENYPAALAFFADTPEIRAEVQRLADRATRAGVSVPGCARVEIEKAV
jgi:hypothetical protein